MFIFFTNLDLFCIDNAIHNARVIYRKIRYFIFLERPRNPWEVHAEPLGLRGAQVGNLWSKTYSYAFKTDGWGGAL